MRNLFVIVSLFISLATGHFAMAQTHYAGQVSIGVKAGADMSRVGFYPSISQKMQAGVLGGVRIRYVEENHFGILAELSFVQRGWKEDFEELHYNYSRSLNYLEIPVMTHIYFGRRGRFFFNAGPQFGLYLGEKISSNFNYKNIEGIKDFPIKNRHNEQLSMKIANKIDYGISAGLGGEFFINPRNSLDLEARFYFGLGNIMSAKRADTFSGSNSMTFSLTAGYWFRLK